MRRAGLILVLLVAALPRMAQQTGEHDSPEVPAPVQAVTTPKIEVDFDPATSFVNANTAYEEGDYGRAILLYRSLLEHGHESAQVYYNLGNALLRGGELGQAIAAYRRSQTLAPREEDLEANLAFARRTAKDALIPPEPSPLAATLFFWHYRLSRSELAMITIVLNLLLWTLVAIRIYRPGSELLRWAFMVVLIATVATGGSLAARYLFPTRVAVVIPTEIDAHTGPDASTVVRFKLHAGSEVLVRDSRDGWLRVALPDGQQGWLAETHVEAIAD